MMEIYDRPSTSRKRGRSSKGKYCPKCGKCHVYKKTVKNKQIVYCSSCGSSWGNNTDKLIYHLELKKAHIKTQYIEDIRNINDHINDLKLGKV